MQTPDNRSISVLFADALTQFSHLIRTELQLARAEISQKATQAMAGISLLALAGIVLVPTLVVIFIGVAALLVERGLSPSTANFIAGGVGLVVTLILYVAGSARLKANQLVPEKTIHQLQQDAAAVKQQV
jgi:membrane protein implicated in regulation of membrane protease activity